MELLAIADRRVAELNEEIRMLEKQVTETTNLGNVVLLKLGDVRDPWNFHLGAFTKTVMDTSNSTFVQLYILWQDIDNGEGASNDRIFSYYQN